MRALLLVHQGAPSTAKLVAFLRDKGFEPYVLSSATGDNDAAFRASGVDLGVEVAVSEHAALAIDEVLVHARAIPDCRFCFSIRDGQRIAMAAANRELGAHDAAPEAIERVVDKHRMRHALVAAGLTALRPLRLDDPELRSRLDGGERYIVKPRSGAGSLCTRVVSDWDEVLDQRAAFARGSGGGGADQLGEYYTGNELIAETFFDGRELSFEVIRQGGETKLASDHERTVRTFTPETVLERGFASPPVLLSGDEVRVAREHLDRVLTALDLGDGCYHVELSIGADGACEIIEVNPRPGGQYMVDSVRLQLGRALGDDWVDVLTGVEVPPAGPRRCGTYYQAHYLEPHRQVIGLVRDPELPEPTLASGLLRAGRVARADREELGAMSLWQTELATHEEQVRVLMPRDYVSFDYAQGLRGRPLFLAFEPGNHSYQVVQAADRLGYDVVVFHARPIPSAGPYARYRTGIALAHPIASWDDWDDCFAQVLAVCGDRPVAGTYCAVELMLEFEARVQEHFGVPTRGRRAVHELLDKVVVRRRLVEAGLSRLQVYDREQAQRLRDWPVGEHALYFKPVHGAGSAFVRRCTTLDEVHTAIKEWNAADRSGILFLGRYLDSDDAAFFLEEEAVGELLSVEGFMVDGRFHSVGLTSRLLLRRDTTIEMGTVFPYEHPRQAEIVAAVARMHDALGITHGPTHTEVVVQPDGPIELVELNLRFIGSDCVSQIELASGVPITEDVVTVVTGGTPRAMPAPRRFACLQLLMAPRGLGRLESIELPAADLPFVRISVQPGSALASTDRQIDQIGSFIVVGDSYDEALRHGLELRRQVLVNGEPLGEDPNNVVTVAGRPLAETRDKPACGGS